MLRRPRKRIALHSSRAAVVKMPGGAMYKNALTPKVIGILCLGLSLLGIGCDSAKKQAHTPVALDESESSMHEMAFEVSEGDQLYSISEAPAAEPILEGDAALNAGPVVPPAPPPVVPILNYNGFLDGSESERTRRRKETVLFFDDFSTTFDVGTTDEKWLYFNVPGFIADDGIATITNGALNVRSSGTNMNNEPVFTKTVPQDTMPGQLSGAFDHVKFLVYSNYDAPNGFPGYRAIEGKELLCETVIRGQTFNTSLHPFGVAAAQNDPRLASFTFNTVDLETFMVFDFFLTNDKIYVIYERLPAGRGPVLGNYAAFTYMIEVGTRVPGTYHRLGISYDRLTGTVRWLINNKEVFKVTEIGKLMGTDNLTIDHGGDEPTYPLILNQLNCGMGQFTLLDGFLPTQTALVRLSGQPAFYLHPITKMGLTFFDEMSLPGSRLFGQGASMDLKSFSVKYITFE